MQCRLANKEIKENYIIELLKERGIQDIENYLYPKETNLLNPIDLNNIEKGAQLLLNSINEKKLILIIVDCDVDGFTSSAIIYQYIKNINNEIEIDYLLHEHKQHGLEDKIEYIMNSNKQYGLIILPDSSSNDKIYHDKLKEINTPCLILDHHEVDNTNFSDNAIIINNQLSKKYLNKDLTGAGVVWQFCRYIDKMNGTNYANKYIDLAALGICGDMGSILSQENNYIIKKGFNNINNSFFKALIEKQSYSMNSTVTPMSVAFYIVPMINALIRVGTLEEKERLFLAFINGETKVVSGKRGSNGELERVDVESVRECTNAKNRQNKIGDNMTEKLEFEIKKNNLLDNKILFIVLDDSMDFPSELNGLIAMRLASKYKRPTILTRLNEDGFLRGSARGIDNTGLKDFRGFLNESGLFEWNLGHAAAFGSSIHQRNLDKFIDYSNQKLSNIDFNENIYDVNFIFQATDSKLSDLIFEIGKYSDIWGTCNNEPLIYITDLFIDKNNIKIVGKKKDTIQIIKNNITYIKFHAEKLISELEKNNEIKIEIIGKANLNKWNGNVTPQIFIDNYEIKESSILDF